MECNWKSHRAWQPTKFSPVEQFSTVPKVIDLIRDPREERQSSEPYNTWLQYSTSLLVNDFQRSVQQCPNVPAGALDSYSPAPCEPRK